MKKEFDDEVNQSCQWIYFINRINEDGLQITLNSKSKTRRSLTSLYLVILLTLVNVAEDSTDR